jgi:Ni/Fe-hydrogenase subunit HybB-like protein
MGMSPADYSRSLVTPFNLLAAAILATSLPVFYARYTQGLATVIHANHEYPWGLLLSWEFFPANRSSLQGFVVAAAYYLFGMKQYRVLVRLAVLGGMLDICLSASYLLIDLAAMAQSTTRCSSTSARLRWLFVVAWHVGLLCNRAAPGVFPVDSRMDRFPQAPSLGYFHYRCTHHRRRHLSTVHQSPLAQCI